MCFLSCSLDSAPALAVPVLRTLRWAQGGLFWLLCPCPTAPEPLSPTACWGSTEPPLPLSPSPRCPSLCLGLQSCPSGVKRHRNWGFVPLVPPSAASPCSPRFPIPSSSPISSSFPGKGSILRAGGTPAVEAAALIRRCQLCPHAVLSDGRSHLLLPLLL